MPNSRIKQSRSASEVLADYRHDDAKRKNNPPAKIAAEGAVPPLPKIEYSYSPRLSPELRFDPTGEPDKLPELLEEARTRALTDDELKLLAEALRKEEPWLEWAGKREKKSFTVEPVALHIHERVSSQAILRVAARQDAQRDLFADPQQQYHEAVQFYQHDVDWANRLILGDSLQVMTSLAEREDLAGRVQMIYIDPPYGIKFKSNFQPEVDNQDVKDRDQDLTREPEMIKAYRDTWHLGIHSYLTYLRDRLVVARRLLKDTGSIFVQINEENLHRIRQIMDEVFGPENSVVTTVFRKKSTTSLGQAIHDYILWYAKNRSEITITPIKQPKRFGDDVDSRFKKVQLPDGSMVDVNSLDEVPEGSRYVNDDYPIDSQDISPRSIPITLRGRTVVPGANRHWTFDPEIGMERLALAERIRPTSGASARGVIFWDDDNYFPISNLWDDVLGERSPVYVVQTNRKVIERCLLMTTKPGDLVLDPTCGSGSTAYVAEQWGRRWITTDTSRVAIAIARQRLLTASFEHYELKEPAKGISADFRYNKAPTVSLKSIAQNSNLDPIFERHEPILKARLQSCNNALSKVPEGVRRTLAAKLAAKQKEQGKKSITDADRRRWILPPKNRDPKINYAVSIDYDGWYEWEVPFDVDPDWPSELQQAVLAYRQAWCEKMKEVTASTKANAEPEDLIDDPVRIPGITRVSGPFTVEAVQPPEMSLTEPTVIEFGHVLEELTETFDPEVDEKSAVAVSFVKSHAETEIKNIEAYLGQMMRLLKGDGVRFPNNKQMMFSRLDPIYGTDSGLQAEGRWFHEGGSDDDPEGRAFVAVGFGPQYGPVTAYQVEQVIRDASRRGYDDLVIAGFSFDGPAQAVIAEAKHPRLRIHMANIRPDVNPGMEGLLKELPGSQLFTVFGQPRTRISGPDAEGNYTVTMQGVDIYNPVENSITPTGADKVAAWFIDGDYNGWTFCITQAFFPDKSAWEKLSRALNGPNGVIDADAFAALSGTVSLPFPAGKHKTVAVKVIDPRGNEVMAVHKLN